MSVNLSVNELTYLGLPTEIKERITENLPGSAVLNLAQVNKEVAELYHDDNRVTWEKKCKVEYPNQPLSPNITWKRHYINLYHDNLPFNRGYKNGFNNVPNLGRRIGRIVSAGVVAVAGVVALAVLVGDVLAGAGAGAVAVAVAGVGVVAGASAGAVVGAVVGVFIINASGNLGEKIAFLSSVRKLCGMTMGSWEYLKSSIRK